MKENNQPNDAKRREGGGWVWGGALGIKRKALRITDERAQLNNAQRAVLRGLR